MNNANQNNRPNNSRPFNKNGPNRNNRRRYRGHPNKSRPLNPKAQIERLVEKYINLLDQHLVARKKFHDLYYRAEIPQLNKLERIFNQTLFELREFEKRIPAEQLDAFNERINGLERDTTYSTNHNIDPNLKEIITDNEISDPHLLKSQKAQTFKEDKEESIGSLDDYNRYKNI
jgi:hypothetical protein